MVTGPMLFTGLPESGLLNPLLVLAGEMARQGVPDLWFATDEHRRDDVERLSVRFASLGPVEPELSAVTWDDAVYREVTQASRFKAFRAAMRQSHRPRVHDRKRAALGAVVDQLRPALMVIDVMSYYGVDVARSRGIPYVLSVPFVASNVLTRHLPFGRTFTPPGFPVPSSGLPAAMTRRQRLANRAFQARCLLMPFDRVLGAAFREDARLRAAAGLPPSNEMARIEEAALILCYSIAELDYPFTVPDHVRMLGAMIPPLPEAPRDGELTTWLDRHESVAYWGFGTITRLSRDEVGTLVEVARRLEGRHDVLWKLPAGQQHLLPDAATLPSNLRIESWVPSQLDVLAHPHVRVFFNHGGGNAYHEAAYFGTPQVVRPLWVDCYDQAVRVQDLGLGLRLDNPRELRADYVEDKLVRVLGDPAYTGRAQRIAALQRAAGGRETAADLLVALNDPVAAG
jgi:polyene glycosyltransferase